MFSFDEGMQTLPNALSRALGGRVWTDARVTSLKHLAGGFEIRGMRKGKAFRLATKAVATSIPAYQLAPLIAPLSKPTAAALREIVYPPVAEIFLGFRSSDVARTLDGFGFLVPAKENRQILGTIWSSSLFPQRAPENHVALTSFVGGSRQPELYEKSDAELVAMVTEELRSIMSVSGIPVFSKVIRWQKAIPQYNIGYKKIVDEMERCERENAGLFFCSNFKGGIAVGDCVMNGKKVAEKVISSTMDTAI
ncbi:MAG: protoporphyrinogen oxidase, partial [Ignavibacteriae bacterium]|nr:protoporphyrinogen oxidase [Ignavibacteriota bacterium]